MRVLTRHGYEVFEAGSAHAALGQLDDAHPDLVIMDIVLPGMQGRDASNLLQARKRDLEVLYISGYTNQELIDMGYLKAGESFLRKPFGINRLLAAVRRIGE